MTMSKLPELDLSEFGGESSPPQALPELDLSEFGEEYKPPSTWDTLKEAIGAALIPNDAVTAEESSPASVIAKNGIKVPGGKNIVEQAGDMMVSDAYKEAEEQKTNTGEKYDPAQYTPAENYEQQVKLKEFAQKTLSKREADGMQQVSDELSGKLEHDPVRSLADSLTSQTEQGKVREETLRSVAHDPIDVIGRQYLPGSKVDDVLETARVHESGRQAAIASTKQKAQDSVAYQAVNDTMRGTDNLQSLGGGLLSMGADVLGAPDVRDEFMKIYTRNQREAEEHPAVIGTYKNVHGFGDAGRYAVEAVFENIPMFLPSLVTGGVGAATARKGAEKLVADMIKVRVAKNIPLEVAEKEAAKFIAGRIAIGSAAGAAPSAIGMETGSIYGDIYEKTGEYRPAVALAYGTAAGALDVIPSVMALKKVFGAGLVDQVKKSFVRRYGTEGLKQFSAEAITEGMQTALERLAVQHVDGKQQAFTQQGVDEIIDSMLKGGVGGGTMGVGSQAAADVLDYGNGTVNPSGQPPTAGIPPVQPQDTGAIPAESLLGTPEPEQTSPVVPAAKPAGVLSRAALAAVQQGITPLNQPTAEVSNAQVQPGAANEQPNIGTAGADTNVLQPQTGNSGENADIGNGLDPVAGGMDEQGSGQQADAAAIDDSIPGRAGSQDVARPRFNNPHEERAAAHLKQAQEHGDSESVISRYAPKDERDMQTGFFDKSTKVETVKRAQKFAEEHNTTAHFIYADLANLGGINEHFENDNDKADLIFRAEADIFRQEVERYSPDAVFKRTGGDELGATVIGATTEELQAAAEQTRIKMLEYARKNGLVDIPRKAMRDKEGNVLPSDPRLPFGIGMYIGIAEIKKGDALDDIFSRASKGMNDAKMRGRNGLIYGATDQQTEGLGEDSRTGTLDRRPRGVRGRTEPAAARGQRESGAAPASLVQGESGTALNTPNTGRAGANPADNESGQAPTVKAPSKKPHQETLAEYSFRKRKQFNIAEGEAENRGLALEHLDHIESALEEGYKVQPSVLAGHADIDAKEFPRIAKLRGIAPQKSEALTDDKPGNEAAGQIQAAIEQLIRNRKTAGQFGLAPNLDAVIRAAKAYLKGEKFNKSLFNKTADKFQRHDAGIATTIRGIIDTVSQGKKAGPKVSKPSNDLIQRIKQLGGISSEYAEDFGAKDAKFYVKSAFKKGGESPDFVARQLKDEGYPLSEDDLIGGLSEFVRRYIAGERSFKHVDTEAAAMSEHDDRAFMELVPDAEKYGINWREFKSPDDLYIAIDNAKFALSDAEEAARDIVLGDSDITLDDAKQSTAAEVDTWLQGDNNARGHTESAAGTATREQVKSDAVGTQNTDGTQEQARPSLELKGQTNAEIAKQEAAKAKAEAEKEAPAKNVTADQADMFSTQNTLFNSNRDGTQVAPIVVENHADLKQAEKQVNTNPSDAQKESGNYAKGHIQWNGLDITIENPAGSERTGTDADGEKWSVTMPATYGYIRSFKPVGSDQSLPQSTITAPDLFGNKTNAFTGANQAINFGPIIENLVAGISTINSSIPKSFSQRTLGDIKSLGDSSTINSFREQLKSLVNIPSDKPSGSIDSLILQAARDGVATDTYIFGNSGNAEAIRSKGFNSLNIETQRMVQNHMLSIFQDGEIRKSIVQLIPINMVDMLVHEKFSANNRLDNKAMLLERLSASSTFDDPIFVGRIIDTIASNLPVAFASRIAKEMHGAGNFAGVTFNALATKITGYSDSHNSPSKSLKSYYSTKGADGDHIDVYIGKHHNSDKVFIVDQNDHKNGNFDEHKVMLGFDTLREAERTYKAGFSDGKGAARMGKVSVMSLDEFKAWLAEGDTTKPAADITPPAEKNALADALEKYDDSGEIQTVDDLANEVERLIDEGQAPASLKSAIDDYHDAQDENHEMAGRGDMDTAEEEFISAIKSAINPVKKSTERTKLDNATAPEHVSSAEDDGAGVSVQELKQISAAFRSHINSGGDSDVTHIFDDPKKSEIVRLNDKAKIYKEGNGWMTPAEAKAEIATWKENARKQGKNETSRNANSQKVVLSLFDLSGEWSKPWVEAGYQVYRFDIQDDPTVGDINNFSTGFFNDWFGDFEGMDIHAILAACPCTDFAVSGARHFAAKDADGRTVSSVRLVKGTLAAIEYFKPAVWALENPVGRIEGLTGLPNWRLSFDPNHLGDTYTKKTLIWGRFNADLPVAPVDPVEGSKMHTQYGGKSMATKNARSVTPEGFAYGFFQANNIIDNPVMAVANKFDRLDRSLMQKAVDAGITVEEINDAVEDFYYMDLDDDAANAAIQELISAAKPPPAKAKIAAGNIITDAEIPKGLKLKISKKLVDAKKAMAAANQRVAKLEALKGCMA